MTDFEKAQLAYTNLLQRFANTIAELDSVTVELEVQKRRADALQKEKDDAAPPAP